MQDISLDYRWLPDGARKLLQISGQAVPGLGTALLLLEGLISLHEYVQKKHTAIRHVSECMDETLPTLHELHAALQLAQDPEFVEDVQELLSALQKRLEGIQTCLERAKGKGLCSKLWMNTGKLFRELRLYQLGVMAVLSKLTRSISQRISALENAQFGPTLQGELHTSVSQELRTLQAEKELLNDEVIRLREQQEVLKNKVLEEIVEDSDSIAGSAPSSLIDDVVQAFFRQCGVDATGPLYPQDMCKLKSKGLAARLVRLADTDQDSTISYKDMQTLCQQLLLEYHNYCRSLGVGVLTSEQAAECLCDFFGVSSTHADRFRVHHLAQDLHPFGVVSEYDFLHLCMTHVVHDNPVPPEQHISPLRNSLLGSVPGVKHALASLSAATTHGLPGASPPGVQHTAIPDTDEAWIPYSTLDSTDLYNFIYNFTPQPGHAVPPFCVGPARGMYPTGDVPDIQDPFQAPQQLRVGPFTAANTGMSASNSMQTHMTKTPRLGNPAPPNQHSFVPMYPGRLTPRQPVGAPPSMSPQLAARAGALNILYEIEEESQLMMQATAMMKQKWKPSGQQQHAGSLSSRPAHDLNHINRDQFVKPHNGCGLFRPANNLMDLEQGLMYGIQPSKHSRTSSVGIHAVQPSERPSESGWERGGGHSRRFMSMEDEIEHMFTTMSF